MSESFGAVVPLESNPEIFTDFARKLGLSPLLSFGDIYSIDDPDLVAFLPRPMNAVILLFPITKDYEQFRASEEKNGIQGSDEFGNIYWFKQLLKNACGLYGLLHAVCNLPSGLIVDQSKIGNFLQELRELPDVDNENHLIEKARMISQLFLSTYSEYSQQGQTEAPSADEDVDLHFICFTKGKNGHFFELDGRRLGPVDLGESHDSEDVLGSTIILDRIRKYMSLANNSMNFAMMGLGPVID
ncbi:DEKNAAC103426 [Brettanomyces naardenensis]|uniref:Ubiquitin carboxyl-terminal hydrolase n=1 Tax=Brettanomyces naardenensis TaxID=13370 RepID=A0A448YND2_BRENA|nr:DEKNAAC103426 [Brettanomyces naardenensis]